MGTNGAVSTSAAAIFARPRLTRCADPLAVGAIADLIVILRVAEESRGRQIRPPAGHECGRDSGE